MSEGNFLHSVYIALARAGKVLLLGYCISFVFCNSGRKTMPHKKLSCRRETARRFV